MLTLVFVILGGAIGAGVHDFGGFLIGAVLGYCLGEVLKLRGKVRDLERAFHSIEERYERPARVPSAEPAPEQEGVAEGYMATDASETVREPSPSLIPPIVEGVEPPPSAQDTEHPEERAPFASKVAEPPSPVVPPVRASSFSKVVAEWVTGGNLLVKVGVLVLFVGVAFLVRYAAERNILPIEIRLAAVTIGAAVLLGVGWRLRERRRQYALVLQGGAVAVLYLTVFGAMRLYGLIPAGLAFPLLVALGAISGALSILQDARVLASFGIAGGFAAPILTSTGQGSHVLLFSYYAVLNLGVVGIAWYKAWRELNLIGFLFTFAIGTAWGVLAYRSHQFATTEPFLILFFAFYVAVAILFALRQPPDLKGYVDGTLVFGLPIIAFSLQNALVKPYPYGLAWSAFALAGLYIGAAWILFLKAPQTLRLMAEAFLAIGMAFGTLTIPLALDNHWTAAAWAMEGAALVWVGVRQGRMLARLAGMLLVLAAGFAFLIKMPGSYGTWPVLNGFWLGSATISLGGLFSGYCLERYRERCKRYEGVFGVLLGVWGLVWWYGAGLREIEIHVPRGLRDGATLLFLSVSSLSSDLLRVRLSWPFLGYPAWALVPFLVLFAASVSGQHGHPFQHGGWWGWFSGLGFCGWLLWRQDKASAFPGREPYLHPPFFLLLVWVATWEATYRTRLWIADAPTWSLAALGVLPALCAVFLSLRGRGIRWPIQRHREQYLIWGNAGLCVFAWLWILQTAFSSDGNPSPLPYLPVLNPLDITAGIAFLAILLWEIHTRRDFPALSRWMASPPWNWAYPAAFGLTVFLWLNAILARTWHHWGGVGFSSPELFRSMAFQASVSIFWSLTALCVMVYATRRSLRRLWIAGAGLMGVTVIKLFLVDLAKAGTLGRVVSFISVGILILVVGYFSPVPPRSQEETQE